MGVGRVLRIEGGAPKPMKHDCTTPWICIECQRRPCDQVVVASIGAASERGGTRHAAGRNQVRICIRV